MRNFAAILAISAVVGTMLLVLVFLLPVGPMRRNVEKSVGDMLKTGDEIPEDAFSKYLWKTERLTRNSSCLDHCRTTSFCAACKVYLPDFERCGGCSHYFYCFDCQKRKKVSKKLKKIEKSVRIRLQRKDRHAIM